MSGRIKSLRGDGTSRKSRKPHPKPNAQRQRELAKRRRKAQTNAGGR